MQIDIEAMLARLQGTGKGKNKAVGDSDTDGSPEHEHELELSAEDITAEAGEGIAGVREALADAKANALAAKAVQVIDPDDAPLPFQLRGLNFASGASRVQIIEQLSAVTPLNECGLPIYIYRADLIDPTHLQQLYDSHQGRARNSRILDYLDAATIYLKFPEGFPTFPDGSPFWMRMPHESPEAYQAFMSYLELGGARAIHRLNSYSLDTVAEWFQLFYWSARVKAFELYRVADQQQQRLQRMLVVEDSHYQISTRLFKQLGDRISALTPDDVGALELPELVRVLDTVIKMQRVAAGLPAGGPPSEAQVPKAQSIEVIMRQTARVSDEGTRTSQELDGLDIMMDDPESLEAAQKLVIKMNSR